MQLIDQNSKRPAIAVLLFRIALILLALMWVFSSADANSNTTDARIKNLALEAILEKPEIIQQALEKLKQDTLRQSNLKTASLLEDSQALDINADTPVLGNPQGDVTVLEFFDYNCKYCKQVKPHMLELLAHDPNVRVLYREWPILGRGSTFAARAALASRKQGKYETFHWALMSLKGHAGKASVLETAAAIGLDIEQLLTDMNAKEVDRHLARSKELARRLNITGTPTFIVGNAIAPGLLPADRLIELVNEARAGNK